MPKGHRELSDPQWLAAEYIDKQRTLSEIARELDVTNGAVSMTLKRAGVQGRSAAATRALRGTTYKPPVRFPQLRDRAWLERRYVEESRSQLEIAQEIGCTSVVVVKAMRHFGIAARTAGAIRFGRHPRGTMLALHDVAWLRAQREAGRTRADIAAELGCSIDTLSKALWRQGIRVREPLPYGEALVGAPVRERKTSTGYVHVWAPDHPSAMKERGYVPRHRLVAEKELGRYLTKLEAVHHLNITPGDDRPENLIVFPNNGEHMRFHANPPAWVPRCKCCGKPNPEALTGRPDGIPMLFTAWPRQCLDCGSHNIVATPI